MASYNKITLVGRLGKDPEARSTPSGKRVCNFNIATDEGSKSAPVTMWHSCAIWNEKTVEVAERYLTKGKQVLVEGRLQAREFTTKDGTKVQSYQVLVDRLVLLGSKDNGAEKPFVTPAEEASITGGDDDGVPF